MLRSSSGVVVKLLAYKVRGTGWNPGLAATISDLLLSNGDMAEISLKRHKSSKQPTNQLLCR